MCAQEFARRRIGVLGHGISLYDELSATENLMLFARLYGLDEPRKKAHRMAGAHRARARSRRPGARIFARHAAAAGGGAGVPSRPELLLFDEPFTALDDRAIAVLQSCSPTRTRKDAPSSCPRIS